MPSVRNKIPYIYIISNIIVTTIFLLIGHIKDLYKEAKHGLMIIEAKHAKCARSQPANHITLAATINTYNLVKY